MHIRLIVHDIRSCHNVGSLLRTADGIGVEQVYLTGYTPYPTVQNDARLPHIREKLSKQINKTALGAEDSVPWSQHESIEEVLQQLRRDGYLVVALEQDSRSVPITEFAFPDKTALLLGREVEGIESALLSLADAVVELPMLGHKESFNVVQAAAMALYHCRFVA